MIKHLFRMFWLFPVSLMVSSMAAVPTQEHVDPLAQLPVQHEGRIKPMDSFARISLLTLHGRSSMKEMSALQWLMELMLDPATALDRPLIKIRNPDVWQALGLENKDDELFSIHDISASMQSQMNFVREAHQKPAETRTLVENQMLDLYFSTAYALDLSGSLEGLLPDQGVPEALAEDLGVAPGTRVSLRFLAEHQAALDAYRASLAERDPETFSEDDLAVAQLGLALNRFRQSSGASPLKIVPADSLDPKVPWLSPGEALKQASLTPKQTQWMRDLEALMAALDAGESPTQIASRVETLSGQLKAERSDLARQLSLEVLYNRADLFTRSAALYVLAFLLLCASLMLWTRPLRGTSLIILYIGAALHAAGLILRMLIMGRPPVSTLYESIVFVGFVCVLVCIPVEHFRKNGLGILIATTTGAVLHFLGFSYAAEGDTLGMLVAVLNSNFWLATHVVTITIGYGCAFVAGMVGHIYLFYRLFSPQSREGLNSLGKNMLGLALMALFFSLFGTILGGIWADQSWGRFWGWDPKENGALLIVVWLLVLLHARQSNMLKYPGFAFGLVINNIIVALAWFGVNLLNVGLHSYGFTGNIARNLLLFCVAELLIGGVTYGLGLWRTKPSMKPQTQE